MVGKEGEVACRDSSVFVLENESLSENIEVPRRQKERRGGWRTSLKIGRRDLTEILDVSSWQGPASRFGWSPGTPARESPLLAWPGLLTRLPARPQGHGAYAPRPPPPSMDEIVGAPGISAAAWAKGSLAPPTPWGGGKEPASRCRCRGPRARHFLP